jgi:hypothetical protein
MYVYNNNIGLKNKVSGQMLVHKYGLWKACSAFCVVWTAFIKFGVHAGNIKFNTQNEEWIVKFIWIIFHLRIFLYVMCNKHIPYYEKCIKMQFPT